MKTKHFAFIVKPGLPLIAMTMLVLLHLHTSCTKKTTEHPVSVPFSQMAEILNGEIISGYLICESSEGFMVQTKEARKIFILEKIENHAIETPQNIQNADVLYCQYGLIISDTEKNKIWLYIKNDEESRKKFEMVKSRLNSNSRTSDISGWTRINLN